MPPKHHPHPPNTRFPRPFTTTHSQHPDTYPTVHIPLSADLPPGTTRLEEYEIAYRHPELTRPLMEDNPWVKAVVPEFALGGGGWSGKGIVPGLDGTGEGWKRGGQQQRYNRHEAGKWVKDEGRVVRRTREGADWNRPISDDIGQFYSGFAPRSGAAVEPSSRVEPTPRETHPPPRKNVNLSPAQGRRSCTLVRHRDTQLFVLTAKDLLSKSLSHQVCHLSPFLRYSAVHKQTT
ncbi:hypothetical protein BDK51DRAFT_46076 [Blyttiomyces helicus]|uniref:Uncharacterized protein n=1 Tax=Blyttiomyces helicus TaxID=388810 RepID=A0A4P9W4U5_9FUNG|nr:hypothetical protein BDK51DRAFT_46076 [Blyttiomyces helicus]|eukprot:RKO86313.1 hypothetical protein BDK51DRAFT_46076 [Blyttiomyces helicus]